MSDGNKGNAVDYYVKTLTENSTSLREAIRDLEVRERAARLRSRVEDVERLCGNVESGAAPAQTSSAISRLAQARAITERWREAGVEPPLALPEHEG